MGKGAAAVVLLFDVLKGVASIFAIMLFLLLFMPVISEDNTSFPLNEMFRYTCVWIGSLTAVIGHCYPVYYKFKGGKAILVTVATLFVIDWLSAIIMLSLFIIIVAVTRYVSVGSVIAAGLYPVCLFFIGRYVWDNSIVEIGAAFAGVIAVLLIFKHRANIRRLRKGTEVKIGQKDKYMQRDE